MLSKYGPNCVHCTSKLLEWTKTVMKLSTTTTMTTIKDNHSVGSVCIHYFVWHSIGIEQELSFQIVTNPNLMVSISQWSSVHCGRLKQSNDFIYSAESWDIRADFSGCVTTCAVAKNVGDHYWSHAMFQERIKCASNCCYSISFILHDSWEFALFSILNSPSNEWNQTDSM